MIQPHLKMMLVKFFILRISTFLNYLITTDFQILLLKNYSDNYNIRQNPLPLRKNEYGDYSRIC